MNRLRVVIADAQELIRIGIRTVLESERNVQVVGEAATGAQAVDQVKNLKPDIIFLGIVMPDFDGIEVTRRIHMLHPGTQVIVVSMHDSEIVIREAFVAGANGYVLKTEAAENLKSALATVRHGQRYVSPQISERLANRYLEQTALPEGPSTECLTSREHEIAQLLSIGRSSKQIGEALGISIRTVETHRANIMRKLNVHSVTELMHSLFSRGLIGTLYELRNGAEYSVASRSVTAVVRGEYRDVRT